MLSEVAQTAEVAPAAEVAQPNGQKFYIKTFGCQMNVADGERMAAVLAGLGLLEAATPAEASVIILNGCAVREKAVHKLVSMLGEYRVFKERAGKGPSHASTPKYKGPESVFLGVSGCVGQLEREQLFKRAPFVDFVLGTDAIDSLPEILYRLQNGEKKVIEAEFDRGISYSTETKTFGKKTQAFVNIIKGCDKHCTFCIVPLARGREKSRTIREVLDDVARLVSTGVREITLLGQNVNSFGKGNPNLAGLEPRELSSRIGRVGPKAGDENFPQLLRAIDTDPRCKELKRIRFTSSHPLDFSDELIECYASPERGGVSRLAAHLHLPVQSGSDRVLELMGRYHKMNTYAEQMMRLRELNPDIGLSTDLIVGFPTETEEDFEQTIALLDRLQYDSIYAFAYSPRPGTRAAQMKDDVPLEIKNQRLNRLLKHQLRIAEKCYAARVGKVMEILVEKEAKNQGFLNNGGSVPEGLTVWSGRTSCNRVVNFVASSQPALVGRFVNTKIIGATSLSLEGELQEVIT